MAGAQERELKFEFESGDAVEALVDHAAAGAPSRIQMYETIYFDTPDFDLRASGVSLRVRKAGDNYVQTIKRHIRGGAVARWEKEHAVEGPCPQFNAADAKALKFASVAADKAVLRPVFMVRSERRIWSRSENGVDVEFALDRGEIVAGGKKTELCELEIELKQGAPRDLFDIARALSGSAGLRPTTFTKDERGYRLLDESWGKPARAKPAALTPRMTPRTAFRTIALSCVQHFLLNELVVRRAFNGEAIHQARIALRRLRSALSLFAPIVEDGQTAAIKDDLKWLSDSFGQVRDLDVFEARVLAPREQAPSLGVVELGAHMDQLKQERYRALTADLSSPRWRAGLLRLLEWIEAGEWALRGEEAAETAMAFAARRINKKHQSLVRDSRNLRKLDDEALHDLRKRGKRLRYATEFFGPLARRKAERARVKTFLGGLEALQNTLGRQHDLVYAADMLTDLAAQAETGDPKLMFAAGHLAGEMRMKLSERSLSGAQAAMRTIAAASPL